MFYPQAMTEVELIIPSRDLLDVTKVLSGQGIFHQADSSYMTVKNNESGADLTGAKLDEMITVLKSIDEKLVTISRAIREINARG